MSSDPQPQILGVRSACELLGMLKSREISSVELLEYFVERNDALHPKINAIVTLDIERAVASAKASDQRRLDDKAVGELDGLPMTIKDAIAVAGVRSTGGAVELEHHVPERDAEVVTKVRDAGAVIVGKTNLPRWSGDVQAFNEIFGTTNNP
ncbi:MAG: amidase family protein, partial [Actinomycetota bacterium]|nr:amidase family protein [Actinomycetota bacterium]